MKTHPAKVENKVGMLTGMLLLMLSTIDGGAMNAKDKSLPVQIREWKADSKDQFFDRETIFKYIDGGAELYLAYDFRQVFCRKFTGTNHNEIVLDIYDMGTAADAYGIFTSEREDEDANIGQGSEFGGGLLRFWKDRFFVSILASGGDENTDQAVIELGQAVDRALPARGAEPDLLKYLPQANLDKKKIRFFHQPLLLDKHYFVANENLLNLGPKTDCVLAEYTLNSKDFMVLLLVSYENQSQAQVAYDQFVKIYMPEAKAGLAQMENKKWTMVILNHNLLRIVFEAPDRQKAIALQKAVKK